MSVQLRAPKAGDGSFVERGGWCNGCGARHNEAVLVVLESYTLLCRACVERLYAQTGAFLRETADPNEIDFPFEKPSKYAPGMLCSNTLVPPDEARSLVEDPISKSLADENEYWKHNKRDVAGWEKCDACKGGGIVAVALPGETGSGEHMTDEDCTRCAGAGRVVEGSQG